MQRFTAAVVAIVLGACGPATPSELSDVTPGAKPGRWQLPLATPCAIANGVVTVSLDANEQASLGLDGSNRLVVNTVLCSTATVSNISRINVTAAPNSPSDEGVIIDGSSGFFSNGSSGSPGISIALGAGSGDWVQVIGTSGNDVLISGRSPADEWVTTNHDLFRDVTMTGVEALTLTGGAGNDVLSGSSRNPAWVPTSAFSTGLASRLPLTLQGGDGTDTLIGGEGADTLLAGDGDDTLVASLGDDLENGELGDDTFSEGTVANGGDTLIGGGGTDTVSYAARTVALSVSLGAGANDGAADELDDVRSDIEVVFGGTAGDSLTCNASLPCTLWGSGGNDTLAGRAGADHLEGEAGDDVLQPGAGDDVVVGGAGSDTVSYADAVAAVGVTLGTPGTPSTGNGVTGENDSLDTTEHVVGSSFNDTLVGNALDNRLTGGSGNDTLSGGLGNDVFDEGTSSSGGDTFNGGAGEDRVDYSGRTSPLTVTMDGVAANDGQTNEHDNVGADVENVSGGSAGDSLTGNALGNKLDGLDGADTLNGLDGDDELTGGEGYDTMAGGEGNDILDQGPDSASCDCGNGFDIAICDGSPANCEVR